MSLINPLCNQILVKISAMLLRHGHNETFKCNCLLFHFYDRADFKMLELSMWLRYMQNKNSRNVKNSKNLVSCYNKKFVQWRLSESAATPECSINQTVLQNVIRHKLSHQRLWVLLSLLWYAETQRYFCTYPYVLDICGWDVQWWKIPNILYIAHTTMETN